MLECQAMDILPYSTDISEHSDTTADASPRQSRKMTLRVADEPGWCLFSVDVRNTYGLPFEVMIERNQAGQCALLFLFELIAVMFRALGTPQATTTSTVAPGSTARFVPWPLAVDDF
jgi:trafficking protein particle complex subunit 9